MANRNWASGGKIYSMHVKPVMLNCAITVGATGAVASFASSVVSSVTRNSAGNYTLALQPQTNITTLLIALGSCQSPSSGLSGVATVEIANGATAALASGTAPSVTIKCLDAAGAAVDPASGSIVNVLVIGNDSSVPA